MFIIKECYRAIFSWSFAISLIISLALLFLGWSFFYYPEQGTLSDPSRYDYNAYDVWRQSVAIGAFALFAPLAAALPYANAYLREREQGLARYILLRMSHRTYLGYKFLVNLLAGGLAVAVPLLLFFGIASILYPRVLPPLSTTPYAEPWMWVRGYGGSYFISHPDLYILGRILLAFFFGATYATLGMALSPFVRNRYVIVTFPFIFFWMFGLGANLLGVPVLWSVYVLTPDAIRDSTAVTVFVPLAFIFTISAGVIFTFTRKYSDRRLY